MGCPFLPETIHMVRHEKSDTVTALYAATKERGII